GVNDSELMKPIFNRLEAIYRDKVSFRLFNTAQPEAKRLWGKVSTKTPALLLINREKGFVEQRDSYVKEEDLKALIDQMLAP
ncbi:MAG: hypothetical protein Q8O76_05675, partial [Chloroflexota bacterium]|nr:hypothetical protein [Chloroflexota bacterium]